MKIGLIDVDGHASKKKWGATIYPNLALAKISAYHKAKGDSVEWYDPMFSGHCDIVYMSKVFNFSQDYPWAIDADEVVKGGTGYDIYKVLPNEIDGIQPDFSIYPLLPKDTSYGFLTRGCPNKCGWCVVPKKEGAIHPYWDIERVANGRKKVVLMDNNILAAGDYAITQLQKIIDREYKVDFNQALDARLVDDTFARLLAQCSFIDRRIRFGCDTHAQIGECQRAIDLICSYGYKGEFFLYTMLHGTIEECYDRIHYWWVKNRMARDEHIGPRVYPYAQPYRDPFVTTPRQDGSVISRGGATTNLSSNRTTSRNTSRELERAIPSWQKDMAHWCNKHQLFQMVDFMELSPRKGFYCKEYFKHQ